MAGHLVRNGGSVDPEDYMDSLAEAAPEVKGAGPSTSRAVERYRRNGSLFSHGDTNGAAMRILPVGWAFPRSRDEERREAAVEISRPTHGDPGAVVAATALSGMASEALETSSHEKAVRMGRHEASIMEEKLGEAPGVSSVLDSVLEDEWRPPERGVKYYPGETLAAAAHSLLEGDSVEDVTLRSVELGGDTDTVAAIAGGIAGSLEGEAELPWRKSVDLPMERIEASSKGLGRLRASLSRYPL